MALDEYLYGKIAKYLKKRKYASSELIEKTVVLADIKQRLTILARALTGHAIEIFPAEREGGFKNNNFFFPASFSMFGNYEQNLAYYFFRLIYLSVQKELNLNWYHSNEKELIVAQQKAFESSSIVLEKMFIDFPITKQLFEDFEIQMQRIATEKKPIDYTWLFGKWMRSETDISTKSHLNNFSEQIKKQLMKKQRP